MGNKFTLWGVTALFSLGLLSAYTDRATAAIMHFSPTNEQSNNHTEMSFEAKRINTPVSSRFNVNANLLGGNLIDDTLDDTLASDVHNVGERALDNAKDSTGPGNISSAGTTEKSPGLNLTESHFHTGKFINPVQTVGLNITTQYISTVEPDTSLSSVSNSAYSQAVPEPLSVLGSATALGFATIFKNRSRKS